MLYRINHMPLKINKNEYDRLFDLKINNPSPWVLRTNLCVESFINDIFEENKFLYRIIFDDNYNILKNENHNQGAHIFNKCIGDLEMEDFDHFHAVTFKNDISRVDVPETISGIINFPYINGDWNWIQNFINKVPEDWSVFVINPILMRYVKQTVGLFLTPTYGKNNNIANFNEFIKSKTGYPLFLKYVDVGNVNEIHFDQPDLSLENYIKEMKIIGNNEGLSKLLDFWYDNDCVNVESFEYSFNDFKDNLAFSVWFDINFKEIKSKIPFELVHEETGEILGPFNKFSLDKSFKLADTNDGVLELSDAQVNDLIKGKYDFKLIE